MRILRYCFHLIIFSALGLFVNAGYCSAASSVLSCLNGADNRGTLAPAVKIGSMDEAWTKIFLIGAEADLPYLDIVDVAPEHEFKRIHSIPRTWDVEFRDSWHYIKRLILILKIEMQRGNIKDYTLPSFDEILLVGGTGQEMEYVLRVLKREFKIQPSVVHVVNPNPNDLKIFKFYFKYETEKLKQEFSNLRAVRFYPTFGEYINRYFKPGSGQGGISLAFGGSVFQYDVMSYVEQKKTVRSVWDVLSPGGIFTYFGYSSSVFKQDIMALIPKEEFFYRDDKFDIYIKSLDLDGEAVKVSSAPQILANPERGVLKIGAINLPTNSILQAIEKSI